MLSRFGYAFRETWASFQRNVTLTAAAILTAAVALLLAGATFLIQNSFSNLLAKWQDGVQMIVFVNAGATPDADRRAAAPSLEQNANVEERRVLRPGEVVRDRPRSTSPGRTSLLETLSVEKMPSQLRVEPVKGAQDLLPGAEGAVREASRTCS